MIYNRIPVTFDQLPRITAPYINYQYDVVQILVINGLDLPDYYTVDFCNVGDAETITVTGTPDGVRIPNDLLLTGLDIKAYIILTGIDEGAVETRYEVTIPVRNRPIRQGVEPTPEERLEIETLVNALNDGVTRAEDAATEAEGQADRAETAAENAETAVTHYPKIEDGYWYVWLNGGWVNTGVKAEGVDGKGIASVTGVKTSTSGLVDTYTLTVTYTDSTTDTITFTVTNGRDGTDGTDGVSPGVTIETITGGHRVTITDKDHPTGQSFDVMDGEVSAADLKAVADSKAPVIIDTASGAIASFSDGADGMPIKSLAVSIEPQQDLHGLPYPYPPGAINMIPDGTDTSNGFIDDKYLAASGSAYSSTDYYVSEFFAVTAGEDYTLSCSGSALNSQAVCFYDTDKTYISGQNFGNNQSRTITAPSNAAYARCTQSKNFATRIIQFEKGTTATTPVPYRNVCPISGWTGLNLTRDGENLLDASASNVAHYSSSYNNFTVSNSIVTTTGLTLFGFIVPVKPSTAYAYSFNKLGSLYLFMRVREYSSFPEEWAGDNFIIQSVNVSIPETDTYHSESFTTSANTRYVACGIYVNGNQTISNIQLNLGTTASPYEEFNGETIPISWQTEAGTVYDGEINLTTGKLVANVGMYVIPSNQTWYVNASLGVYCVVPSITNHPTNIPSGYGAVDGVKCSRYNPQKYAPANMPEGGVGVCSTGISGSFNIYLRDSNITTVAEAQAQLAGMQVVYPLEQPVEYQLDPITLNTLYGQNNIFVECGDVSVDYPCDTKLYIDKKLAALVAALS